MQNARFVTKLEQFQKELDYYFADLDLLELALTHRSYSSRNNERLEFLGDSLINHVVAEFIFHKFPYQDEGALSRIRASLVRRDSLADLGDYLNIGDYVILSSGELKNGGRNRRSILADAVEAVAGAIFIDAGFETARQILVAWYSSKFISLTEDLAEKDFKTQIQEYVQSIGEELPRYELESVSGQPHSRIYNVVCKLRFCNSEGRGSGASRQEAEQMAASSVLSKL